MDYMMKSNFLHIYEIINKYAFFILVSPKTTEKISRFSFFLNIHFGVAAQNLGAYVSVCLV